MDRLATLRGNSEELPVAASLLRKIQSVVGTPVRLACAFGISSGYMSLVFDCGTFTVPISAAHLGHVEEHLGVVPLQPNKSCATVIELRLEVEIGARDDAFYTSCFDINGRNVIFDTIRSIVGMIFLNGQHPRGGLLCRKGAISQSGRTLDNGIRLTSVWVQNPDSIVLIGKDETAVGQDLKRLDTVLVDNVAHAAFFWQDVDGTTPSHFHNGRSSSSIALEKKDPASLTLRHVRLFEPRASGRDAYANTRGS